MDIITSQLEQLGLSDYEARIYSVLLRQSPISATHIAKKCQLSRSSVYTTLSALIAKGIVGTTYKNEIKQFVAQDSSTLENLLITQKKEVENRFKVFDSIKDQLTLLGGKPINIPSIMIFEGQEGLKKVYLSMMRQAPKNSVLYLLRDEFIWDAEWGFVFESDWRDRVKRIKIEKNIKTRLLINKSKEELSRAAIYKTKKNLEYSFLPESESINRFAIYILGDIVSILSMEKNNLVGIKITNQHITDNIRNIFDVLWKKSQSKYR